MANPRIDDLRKRLEKEPGSRVFAQLAEELRKDGDLEEAIQVCREGLHKHQSYPSARMTLGRALFESGDLAAARTEFEAVLKGAPDNILASRLLGESLQGLGELEAARTRYKTTLAMAPGDKQVAAKLEEMEAALKGRAVPVAAPARIEPVAPEAEPTPAPEPPPIKVVEVDEPMKLERPHEAPTTAWRPEAAAPAAPEPPHRPPAPEEVVEFDEAPTMPGTAAPSRPERATSTMLPAEEIPPATLPLGTRAPTLSEPPSPPPTLAPAAVPLPPPPILPPVEAVVPAAPAFEPPAVSEGIASVTLAELYFSQGHVDKAVSVLRQLLAREPSNERAGTRLQEIEAREQQLRAEQQRVASAVGPGADARAVRRQAVERTIAKLEQMLASIRKG